MPFYDFKCPTCDERFEVRRAISESDQPVACPNGHDGAKRVITSWGTGGGIRSGTPAKKNAGTVESAAAHLAKHKRRESR